MFDVFRIGDIEVSRIIEWDGEFSNAQFSIADSTPARWLELRDVLVPDHWNAATNQVSLRVQSYII